MDDEPLRLLELLGKVDAVDSKGRYLHWDQMWYREPPEGLTLEEWWLGTRASRETQARVLPFSGTDGNPFQLSSVDVIHEMLHWIDQQVSARIQSDEVVAGVGLRSRYLVSSLVEEAITSSLLEGAATTRRQAKDLLRTGRKPRDHGETMVWNNYHAMALAKDLAEAGNPLSLADVLELHRVVTDGTLEDPSEAGRLQQPGEVRVAVYSEDRPMHVPPPAEVLPERLEQFCAFANGGLDERFLHPVVRAVLLHFWLGHDHPFADGNGRTARAVFYWSMLRSGYWLAEYISISSILRGAPSKYMRSYLHTETDGNDVTYFVVYQLDVLQRAIDALWKFLERKKKEITRIERRLRGFGSFNNRQLAILGTALRDPDACFTIAGHQRQHRVVYQTARTDLLRLEELGLLRRHTLGGRKFEFWPVEGLSARLEQMPSK